MTSLGKEAGKLSSVIIYWTSIKDTQGAML